MKNRKYYWLWTLFLPIQWLIIQFLTANPELVETYYSTGIYPYISQFLRILFGWIPFSLGDLLYLYVIFLLFRSIRLFIRIRRINFLKIIGSLSIVYFAFHFLWGINYLRQPISSSFEIKQLDYTTEDLNTFTINLINEINTVHTALVINDSIKVEIPYSKKEIYQMVPGGYKKLSATNKNLNYTNTSIKHSILSLPLSYMGFSGYLNPFTNEAQVNSRNPLVSYPSTSCHEAAHQLGYAAENEANFIGFLSSVHNNDLYFKYSGYYMALRYALNDLYRHDREKYKTAIKNLNRGVVKNMMDSQKHWSKYQNPFEPLFKLVFNQYLKANKQKSGIKSYSLMVGLLINYEKKYETLF